MCYDFLQNYKQEFRDYSRVKYNRFWSKNLNERTFYMLISHLLVYLENEIITEKERLNIGDETTIKDKTY